MAFRGFGLRLRAARTRSLAKNVVVALVCVLTCPRRWRCRGDVPRRLQKKKKNEDPVASKRGPDRFSRNVRATAVCCTRIYLSSRQQQRVSSSSPCGLGSCHTWIISYSHRFQGVSTQGPCHSPSRKRSRCDVRSVAVRLKLRRATNEYALQSRNQTIALTSLAQVFNSLISAL